MVKLRRRVRPRGRRKGGSGVRRGWSRWDGLVVGVVISKAYDFESARHWVVWVVVGGEDGGGRGERERRDYKDFGLEGLCTKKGRRCSINGK